MVRASVSSTNVAVSIPGSARWHVFRNVFWRSVCILLRPHWLLKGDVNFSELKKKKLVRFSIHDWSQGAPRIVPTSRISRDFCLALCGRLSRQNSRASKLVYAEKWKNIIVCGVIHAIMATIIAMDTPK